MPTQFKLSVLSCALLMQSPLILAQTNEVSEADSEIETILVTAQKRTQRLVDVPSSISALNGELLKQSSAQQLSELEGLVPNMNIEDINSFNNKVSIRGVGSHSRNISFDTRVGVYLDGVYLGQSPGLSMDLLDIERIEVLRGPQGSLFGKNTVAGAINMISKKPSDEVEGQFSARLGNFNARQIKGYGNIPISDGVALKLSASQVSRDGLVENVHPNARGSVGNRDSLNYRSQLLIDRFDDLELLLTMDGSSADERPLFGEHTSDMTGSLRAEPAARPIRVTNNDFLANEKRNTSGLSLEANYQLNNGASLRSITAQRDTRLRFVSDLDYGPLDVFRLSYKDEYDQLTQEFQYLSPASESFEYLLGAYYYQQDSLTDRAALPGSQVVPVSNQTFLRSVLAQFGLDTLVGTPFERLYPTGNIRHQGTVDTQSFALFGNMTYRFSPQWELGLGLRWGQERKKVDWNIDGSGSGFMNITSASLQDKIDDTNLLPSLSLSYTLDRNNVAYLRYATGSKGGGFNLDFITAEQLQALTFDKETSRNIELGIKGTIQDYRLRYGVSVFHTQYDDYQQSQFIDIGDARTVIAIANAASAITQGLEAELSLDLSEEWDLGLSFGYLDATFDQFKNGGVASKPDVSGNRLPESARFQGSLLVDYQTQLTNELMGFAHLDVAYTGDMYTTADNVKQHIALVSREGIDFGYLPSRTTVNTRIGIRGKRWTLALWARNLLDKDSVVYSRRQFLGGIDETWNAPRTFGLEVDYVF